MGIRNRIMLFSKDRMQRLIGGNIGGNRSKVTVFIRDKTHATSQRTCRFYSSMETPIIQVQEGKLRGIWKNNLQGTKYVAFKGIPYAKPPIGDLRFKDSEPVEPWLDVKNATKFGYACPQNSTMSGAQNENCLFLNIYTSDLQPSVKRPVLFWIHGGAFSLGSGDDTFFGPDYFVEKDVVLVTINYRLGVLGFLNVDDEEAPGNQGLKDQVLALKWVQQNISSFGGDPNNVTIFGESAGGASVHYLTISPLAQGLFHKAIMQSGVAINPWAVCPYSPKTAAQRFVSFLGCQITDPKEIIKFLRTVDVNRLLEAEKSFNQWPNNFYVLQLFGPTVDIKSKHPFLSVSVYEAAKSGIKVPCIIGHTSHEGIVFMKDFPEKYPEIDADQENQLVHPCIKKELAKENISVNDLKNFFIGDGKIEPKIIEKLVDLMSATQVKIGIHQMLEIQAQNLNIPTYLYQFGYESDNPMMQKMMGINLKGTCHAEDVAFLFNPKIFAMIGKKPAAPGSVEYLVIQRFLELWTNFAKTGNPTPQTSELIPVDWKPISNALKYSCLNITENLNMSKEKNLLRQIKKFIHEKRL